MTSTRHVLCLRIKMAADHESGVQISLGNILAVLLLAGGGVTCFFGFFSISPSLGSSLLR